MKLWWNELLNVIVIETLEILKIDRGWREKYNFKR